MSLLSSLLMLRTMATINKVEELRKALLENPNQGPVIIVKKDGRHYLSDGWTVGREITPEEEARLRRVKVYIDPEDLTA